MSHRKTWDAFKIEVEELEPLDPFPDMYYVCSHGASIEFPVLVYKKQKEFLESQGVKVYTRDDYLKLRERY